MKDRLIRVLLIAIIMNSLLLTGCSNDANDSPGGQGADFDATNYYTKAEIDALINNYVPLSHLDNHPYYGIFKGGSIVNPPVMGEYVQIDISNIFGIAYAVNPLITISGFIIESNSCYLVTITDISYSRWTNTLSCRVRDSSDALYNPAASPWNVRTVILFWNIGYASVGMN